MPFDTDMPHYEVRDPSTFRISVGELDTRECTIWLDENAQLQTDCQTSAQADRFLDLVRVQVDEYIRRERERKCDD